MSSVTKQQQVFIQTVWDFYQEQGRHDLPWRTTTDPYCICVSELMLQQTQVERVIPKYQAFLKQWPSVEALAAATLGDVLIAWQGLGYNRRAKMLHACAQTVVENHAGEFPTTRDALQALPGIGPYTAGAVMAFAYNVAVPLIETNIRTVYLHHFFRDSTAVTDTDLLRLIEVTMPERDARRWYWALMDYGTHVKRTLGNANIRSWGYTKQSKFEGSDRQIRGAIIRGLSGMSMSRTELATALSEYEAARVDTQLQKLVNEDMVVQTAGVFSLPGK